jgi:UDP-N-acetylglucosamine 2-epimerase (non-hydrolysing)
MPKLAIIFGTRPEAVKLAPVVRALRGEEGLSVRVCVTGQHRELLGHVLPAFELEPDVDLDCMRPGQSLASLAARSLAAIDDYLARETPDLVVIQGDTTTALAAALAAFYRGIGIAHVEAGLRTGNFQAPWPEEAQRVLIARLASLHLAPTARARANLLAEGVADDAIRVTGNPVVDALHLALERIRREPPEIPGLAGRSLAALGNAPVVLVTGHRRENIGPGLESVCQAIVELAALHPSVQFVYPVHLNPQVRGLVERVLGSCPRPNLHAIEPLPYLSFIALLARATLVLSDSGGLQEEAPTLGKPVLVLRATTERPEAVEAGAVKLVGTDRDTIVAEASRLLCDTAAYGAMAQSRELFGDGQAATRIVAACREWLEKGAKRARC